MIKQQGQGKHGKGGEENRLSHDAVALLKTQDAGYLRTVLSRSRREVGRLEEVGGVKGEGEKVVFEQGSGEEKRSKKRRSDGEVVADIDMDEIMVGRENGDTQVDLDEEVENQQPKLKSKKALLAETNAATRLRMERKKRRRLQEVRATKLEMLKRRQKDIMAAADVLELQRAKMAKTIGGVNKNGVKFKIRERKK